MPCAARESISVVVDPVGEVVEVLHAHDRRDGLCFGDLLGGDGADAEMPDQSLLLQLREHAERFGDRARLGAVELPDAQVDDVERVESEVARDCRSTAWRSCSGARAGASRPRRRATLRPWSRCAARLGRDAGLP